MKVILRNDVDDLGYEGDVVDVSKGFARNFLIPKGLGLLATESNIKMIEMQRKKIEERKIRAHGDAEALRDRLTATPINITQKAGEEGKLYGSVTSMDIAEEMEKKGLPVDRRKILLDRPIKTLGEFDVPVKIHQDVIAEIKVVVSAEES